jgi:hypothetical protein
VWRLSEYLHGVPGCRLRPRNELRRMRENFRLSFGDVSKMSKQIAELENNRPPRLVIYSPQLSEICLRARRWLVA